jgi:predicted amidophosphoribosyltransferase
MQIAKTNRVKVQHPSGSGGWCPSCDGAIVWPGRRCPRCGKTIAPKKSGKPTGMMARGHDMLFEEGE